MRHEHGSTGQRRLVGKLRWLQRKEGLTETELAERLGVSISMVWMVFGGWRAPGRKFLRGVLRAYPDLRDEVHLFLLQSISNSEAEDIFW